MKNISHGQSLIGLVIAIGIVVLLAGGVVLFSKKSVPPSTDETVTPPIAIAPQPTPTPTPSPAPTPNPAPNPIPISAVSYNDCVAKGGVQGADWASREYTCWTKDGKKFTKPFNTPVCNWQCGDSQYCTNNNTCAAVAYNTSCNANSDCQLTNKKYGLTCCYAGFCDSLDYSQPNWIAVNKTWLSNQKAQYCPNKTECGESPGCVSRFTNIDYHAECRQNTCVKVADSSAQYGCRVPCTGMTPSEEVSRACGTLATQSQCSGYQSAQFPYRCEWKDVTQNCPAYP